MKRSIPKSLYLGSVFVSIIIIGLFVSSFFNSNNVKKTSAQATGFQAGHIIDNNIFTNSNALTTAQIQAFLNDMVGTCDTNGIRIFTAPNGQVMTHAQWGTSKGDPPPYTCINNYYENPSTLQNNYSNPGSIPSGAIPAAQIIYNAAQAYKINPEVILTTIQKEQGLVTDNWPWYSEYQHSMGYSCPDSSGCSSSYADFYKQVDGAAWQFRYYLNNPGVFNYWIGTNTINYAPGCSGSTVDIQNAATAALYIYTPYQPDSNVLANTNPIGSSSGPGPAISDSCAAYGNRNFWWYFNSWFGPSIDTNVSLGEESGGSTIYVLYDGQKQGIPSIDVLNSWGLNGLPVITLDPSIFNTIPTATTALTRYAINAQSGQSFFADNSNVYYVTSNDASIWGNFSGQNLSQVSQTLINFADYQGEIKPFVSVNGNSTFYVVDNAILHPVSSAAAYTSWAGQNNSPMQLSSSYFSTLQKTGTIVSNPEFSYNGTDYILSDGQVFSLTSNTSALLPSIWTISTINQGLFNSFPNMGNLQYMLQANGYPTVYLLDGGTLRGIPDQQTANDFQVNPGKNISIVANDLINFIPVGAILGSNIVSIGGQSYVVNQTLQPIPSNLISAYNPAVSAISLSSTYQHILSTGNNATAFVKSISLPGIYFIDSGSKLAFSNPVTFSLVAGDTSVTYLTDNTLSTFTRSLVMQNYVTDGTTSYLLDNGNSYTVPSVDMANAWNLNSAVQLSAAGISNFPDVGSLSQYAQIPNGQFCIIDNKAYCAGQAPLLTIWGFGAAGTIKPSQQLLNFLSLTNCPLSQFIESKPGQTYSGIIYTIANGQLIGIPTMNAALNLGITNFPVINLDSYTMNKLMSSQIWQGYLATDNSGTTWVLDGGSKHALPSQYQSSWVGSNTPTALGDDYLSLLPTAQPLSNVIHSASNPTYYGMVGGQRFAFTSLQSYKSSGLPSPIEVSESLLQSIAFGGTWPQ